ncbi:MAG: hypothetical protein GPJ10_15130 [Microcystis aeruginosa L211-07]|nr:hypothetical protein [Microcystis aeruginosa L211-07]
MPLADTLNRNPGDILKSDDWNVIIKEIDRLETAKINRDGADTLKGPLTIAEALNANSNVTIKGNLSIVVPQPQEPSGQILVLGPTNASNLRLGYHQDYSWIQSHGSKPLLINRLGNNIGIGSTINPVASLDIASASRTGTHPTAVKSLYITGDFNADNDGVEFRHSNGTQGIGFGFNTIYAAGSAANQDLGLKPKGTGEVKVAGSLSVSGIVKAQTLTVSGDLSVTGSVSFGSQVRQMLNLWSTTYGIGVQSLTQYFRSDRNFAWYKGGSHNNEELNPGGGAVQMVIKDGNVGIGTTNPGTKLEINGDLKVTGTITGTIDATNIATGTLNVARIPNLSANKIIDVYDIYLRGSAFESTEGNITFLKIANFDFGLTTQRGLNTIILNPGGAYRRKANHDVYGDKTNWNNWADWVNSNAAAGDLVAVASYDALHEAPRGGSADNLLGAINGKQAFIAEYRVSYALFFIKGESKCIEVLQAYRGPNAHLKTGYAFSQLSFNFNNFNSEEAWIVPAFMNSWTNYDTTYNPAGYFKDSLGIVHLRGLVKNGTNNTTIFTLPVGYRPSNRELQAVQTNLNTIGRVDILADGQVTVVSGSNGWVSLDGITFRAGG